MSCVRVGSGIATAENKSIASGPLATNLSHAWKFRGVGVRG